jgi:hypothetical protein
VAKTREQDLRALIEEAEAEASLPTDPEKGAPREIGGKQIPPGRWREMGAVDRFGLPQGNPVIPLGMDGTTFFFLNTLGQVVPVADLKAETVKKLYAGRIDFLYWAFPRKRAPSKETIEKGAEAIAEFYANPDSINGWDAETAGNLLYNAAAMRGVWRDYELVRGRGTWADPEDKTRLVLHCGNSLFVRDAKGKYDRLPPGDLDSAVYPAEPVRPYPFNAPQGPEPGRELEALISTWRFRRGELDVRLLIGYIAQGFVTGALDWRPSVWVTGGPGSGKSTLTKDLMKALLGSGVIYATNVTVASIYQHVGHSSLPTILDEFETQNDPAKTRAVVEFMRQASSGGVVMRGGADGKGKTFYARTPFCFTSIIRHGLRPQDLSRMAILNLNPFEPGDVMPRLDVKELGLLGRKLFRRMVDNWAELQERLLTWRASLEARGHDSRAAMQFGTLMACADVLLEDAPPDSDTLDHWCDLLAPDVLDETAGKQPEWERCLIGLLAAPVEAWRSGKQRTVGALLDAFMEPDDAEGQAEVFGGATTAKGKLKVLNGYLAAAGLKVEPRVSERADVEWWLAVPGSDEKLRQLFRGSDYEGEASVDGAWNSSLQQAPPDMWMLRRSRIDGRQRRCTWLDLSKVVAGDDGPPEASKPPPDNDAPF